MDEYRIENKLITFIVIAVGRESLQNTLLSISQQSNPIWKCIVFYDSQFTTINDLFLKSPHFTFLSNSTNLKSHALSLITTPWFSFIDKEGDTIHPEYCNIFIQELQLYTSVKVIVFPTINDKHKIYPPSHELIPSNFTIHYVMNQSLIQFCQPFIHIPPFHLIKIIELTMLYPILISPYVIYFVDSIPTKMVKEHNQHTILSN